MTRFKEQLEEKTDEELQKIAKLKGIQGGSEMKRKELIEKLVDEYEKTTSTTC
ncbi:MAG: Rho termination factor N-terminal domain-containing protein [Candidatus Saliniplasma sp.]